ncbi:MAG: hypothetical protein JRE23_03295 [Deltaproteobacteria bacterium]|nr:hypothetical protein [Deltaproteobacteria bacterium]
MNLYIPKLGTKIVLTKDWAFTLLGEKRNRSLWDLLSSTPLPTRPWGIPFNKYSTPKLHRTLRKGSVLKFDRVYIRKEQAHHDSVTFKAEVRQRGVWYKVRFFVTLKDANNIEYERVN